MTVNFTCQLNWTKGCPIAGKTLFLDVSEGVSEEVII